MKYLGVDYGRKRIGVAVSNDEGTIAFPRRVFENSGTVMRLLAELAAQERVEHIVVGDTRTAAGAENAITEHAEEFARALSNTCTLPYTLAMEAWSSIEASRHAPEGKGHDDAAAAAIILQRFLDMRRAE